MPTRVMEAATLLLIGEAFVVGLFATPHCLSMCGPFAVSAAHAGPSPNRLGNILGYSLGRTTTYAALCALAGTISVGLENFRFVAWLVSVVAMVFAAAHIMGWIRPAAWAHTPSRLLGRLGSMSVHAEPFVIGLSTALLPCGMVFAAAALAVGAGSTLGGALVGVAFGVGTAPGLGTLGWLGGQLRLQRTSHRAILAALILVTGVGLATMRLGASLVAEADSGRTAGETPSWICVPPGS